MTAVRVKTAGIVVAGGSGERFGRTGGKQLATVAGWPVLSWSVRAFDAAPEIDLIVVVCPAERLDEYRAEAIEPLALSKPVAYATSAATRQESVAAGLAQVPGDVEHVVVHDGARPLITADIIALALDQLAQSGADGVVVGHPSFDTLKVVEGNRVIETPDRSRFWAVQTPQVFARAALERAHSAAREEGFLGTDDASLVERAGGSVLVVEGPRENLKVTVAEDLAYVQAVLNRRRGGA